MVALLPFLLIVIAWNPDAPQDIWLAEAYLMPSAELCNLEGNMVVAESEDAAGEDEPVRYRYFCTPAPQLSDYEEMRRALGSSK